MKKRILVITCGKKTESTTNQLIKIFLDKINEYTPNKFKAEILNIKYNNIKPCTGCGKCFSTGFCNIKNDDMNYLKEKLLNNDIIFFATPVYLNHIPGELKIFLDRLAYWTHLFKLSGKLGTIIITTSNSGVEQVGSYLKSIFNNLGIVCTGIVHYIAARPSFKSLEKEALVLSNYIKGNIIIKATPEMDYSFKTIQAMINRNLYSNEEFRYWKDNGMLLMDSINELISKNIELQ